MSTESRSQPCDPAAEGSSASNLISSGRARERSKVFAPLSIRFEGRKQTMAISCWLGLFFGSIVLMFAIAGFWIYLVVSVFEACYDVYDTVYGQVTFYGSDADRAELAPRLADFIDIPFLIIVGEALLLSALIIGLLVSWKSSPWPVAQRRLFPLKRFGRKFSQEHEFLENSFFRRALVRLYKNWSRWLTSYFPHRLVFDDDTLTEDEIHDLFPEDKNYIFACHPHGMASVSFWSSFCWRPTIDRSAREATGFQNSDTPMRRFMEKYVVYGLDFGKPLAQKNDEEIVAHKRKAYSIVIHTLDLNFIQPFWRELVLRVGLRDVCRKAILNSVGEVEADKLPLSERREKGHLSRISCIVVGGAVESIDHNQPALLTLKKRKGFIRMCVETGACVVPVYGFGENNLYKGAEAIVTKSGRRIDPLSVRFNRNVQKLLGFALPFALGRGCFIPYRKPLVTVVGKPIQVKQCPRPKKSDANYAELQQAFDAEVERAHAEYIACLSALYRRHQPRLDADCPVKDIQLR